MNLNSCGVASVGPQLSVSETGEARNIRPGGANNRTSGSALLTGGARYAPPNMAVRRRQKTALRAVF